ncbi:MAG: NAD(P)/FAD-dependent oxidoreductase [Bacteroidota bacterium]
MFSPRFSDAGVAGLPRAAVPHRIIIVGGGAGGLELAARLGDDIADRDKVDILLVDAAPTHLWKPLLHEVAAGTLGPHENEIDFLQLARRHGFHFHLGRLEGIDRGQRQIRLAALIDESGLEIAPRRTLAYDTLVVAIGATDNDFGTPGVAEHTFSLNDMGEAERFHRRLLALCTRAELGKAEPVHVAIVGGGATGVELAAELNSAGDEIASYGMQLQQLRRPLRISIIEAGPRLLNAMPQEVVNRVIDDLRQRDIDIRLGKRVIRIAADSVELDGGERIAADLTVWAAGVKGQGVMKTLGDLEINRQQQLVVRPTLQTTVDDNIFALGDCASCPPRSGKPAPPTAQAARQQAALLARSLRRRLAGKPLPVFEFHERGSLLALGRDEAVGSVDSPAGRGFTISGWLARFSYWILYRRHLAVLLGIPQTVLLTVGQWLAGRSQPRVKLH